MNSLIRPSALLPGDDVAVLSASSPSPRDRIDAGRLTLERLGFRVTYADNLFERDVSYLSGSDDRRLSEVNRLLADDRFGAFFFSRGGYGAMRILDRIDWSLVERNPRPIIGYSDVTAIHQAVARQCGVSTFHGPMLNTDLRDGLSPDRERWLLDALRGEPELTWSLTSDQVLRGGRAEGTLFGGCLSLTAALIGTPYDYWVDGGIWFWEEVTEPAYRIDRMLTHLRLSGRLQTITGVMIGRLKDCGGDDPSELQRLLEDTFCSSGIPVVYNLPFGHFADNLLLPIGARAIVDCDALQLRFPDPFVDAGRRG
jgi:muramoyltetrapeptide carboxypeptidase